MRTVTTARPSFPVAPENTLLSPIPGVRWQVLCGDEGHWRCGVYSPSKTTAAEVAELEWHDCPELFVLLSGRLCLLMGDPAERRVVELRPNEPILVTAPHAGFCPEGPHTGTALVIERDAFETVYRAVDE